MGRLNFLSASAFPETAPQYLSFVDPTGALLNSLHKGESPPMRPLPMIPTGPDVKSFGSLRSISTSSAPSVPYIPSPQPERPSSVVSTTPSELNPSISTVKSAQANAKHAISALDFEDYAGAVQFLEQALADLK
eukprot:IDg14722t1